MTTLLFFAFYIKQQGRHPILFQSLLDIKNKKQQGRHPI
jgi:hypothetical protein